MHCDGLFTTKEVTVLTKLDESVWLRPVGDIHRDSDLHADGEWQAWLKYAKNDPARAIYLLMGDTNDFARAHVRSLLASNDIVDGSISEALQDKANAAVVRIAEELEPLKDDIVGVLGGNHFFLFSESKGGVTTKEHSDNRLARLLGTDYLGTMCLLTITLKDINNPRNQAKVRVIAHHGVGGGATIGGSLNRVHRTLNGWHADVALFGHDHKRGIVPVGDMLKTVSVDGRDILLADSKWVGRTGSFLRGFAPGKASYAVDMAYEPSSIGTIEVQMKLKKNRKTGQVSVALGGLQPA